MTHIVRAFTHNKLKIITLCSQGPCHGPVSRDPIKPRKFSSEPIAYPFLKKNLDGLGILLTDQFWIHPATTNIDKAAIKRENPSESIGPMPSNAESANPAATVPTDTTVIRICRYIGVHCELGQYFIYQKTRKHTVHAIIFEGTLLLG